MVFNRTSSFLSSIFCSLCTGIRNNFDLAVPNSNGRRTLLHRMLWIFNSLWPIFNAFVAQIRFEALNFVTTARNIFNELSSWESETSKSVCLFIETCLLIKCQCRPMLFVTFGESHLSIKFWISLYHIWIYEWDFIPIFNKNIKRNRFHSISMNIMEVCQASFNTNLSVLN